jgi:hypothetical protein
VALHLIETETLRPLGEPKLPGQLLRMGKALLPVFFNFFEINSQQTTVINTAVRRGAQQLGGGGDEAQRCLFCRRVDRDDQPRADIVANAPDHFVSFGRSIAGKA